jgi:hypothetical protein
MAKSIQWSVTVQVGGQTELSLSRATSVEAVDSIDVEILGTADTDGPDSDREVEIQPSSLAGQVTFFAISTDNYGDDTHFLSYKVNADSNPSFRLDQPLILVGSGAVSALDAAPSSLFVTSSLSGNATLRVLIGRDATPPPSP